MVRRIVICGTVGVLLYALFSYCQQFTIDENTLFLCHFDRTLAADFSRGAKEPSPGNYTALAKDGKYGACLLASRKTDIQIQEPEDAPMEKKPFMGMQYAAEGNINPSKGTVEMWVRPYFSLDKPGIVNIYTLFSSNADTGTSRVLLGLMSKDDGKRGVVLTITDAEKGIREYGFTDYASNMQPGQWYHIAFTWDTENISLWIDGAERGRRPTPASFPIGSRFCVGGVGYKGRGMADAFIDELRISDTVRYKSAKPVSTEKKTELKTEQKELLKNPGFEEGLNGWNILKKDGALADCTVDEKMIRDGARSLFVSKTNAEGTLNLLPAEPVAVETGREYRFRAFCHFSKLPLFNIYGARVTLEITGYDEKGKRSLLARTSTRQSVPVLTPQGSWKQIAVWFKPAPGIVKVEPTIVVIGNPSEFFIDDCSLALYDPKQDARPYHFDPPQVKLSWEETEKFLSILPESSAEIKRINNIPRLVVNEISTPPIFYRMRGKRNHGYCKDFNEAGVKLQMVILPIGGMYAEVWKGPGVYDFEPIDSRIKFALQGNPDGKIVAGLQIGPYAGWTDSHTEDVCLDQNGLPAMGWLGYERQYFGERKNEKDSPIYSYYSSTFQKEMNETIIKVMDFLKKQPYYKSIIGFSLSGGHDGQWRTSEIPDKHLVDYSPAAISSFREYMRRKYGTEENLRKATGLKQATFDNLMPPSAEERKKPVFFRDPSKDAYLADYSSFLSDEIADMLNSFGKTIKENAGKPVFVTTYYCEQIKGILSHLNSADRLRQNPYIDVLCSVTEYNPWRQPGGPGSAHNCVGSLSLHNKLFVNEWDVRTWKTFPDPKMALEHTHLLNIDDFSVVNRRDTGMAIATRQGLYYYDMGGGWFHDRDIMESIGECNRIYESVIRKPDSFRPEVAVILDERSCHWVSEDINALAAVNASLPFMHDALFVSGVPFDVFQLNELVRFPELLKYKIYIFLNTYYVSREERAFIDKNLKKDGKTLVWMYGAGYLDETGKSAERLSDLTGIKVATREEERLNLTALNVDSAGDIGKNAPPVINEGYGQKFWIEDSKAVPFSRYKEGGEIAGALKSFRNWKSIYSAPPGGLSPEIINNIAGMAKVYICTDAGLPVWVNDNFLSVHGTVGGKHRIQLPRRYKTVTDAFSGEVIARNATHIDLDVSLHETYWFLLD